MKRNHLNLLFLSITILLISACSFQFSTVIESDGSGEFSIEMEFTEDDFALMGAVSGEELLDQAGGEAALCGEMGSDLGDFPSGARVEYQEKDGGFVCKFFMPFSDLDELNRIYADMDIDVNRLEIVDGNLEYDVAMDTSRGESDFDIGFGLIEIGWSLTVPGTVGDNNATNIDGRTLTWEMDGGAVQHFEAQSSSGGSFPSLPSLPSIPGFSEDSLLGWILALGFLCLCGLVLVGGGVGFYFYNKKKKEAVID